VGVDPVLVHRGALVFNMWARDFVARGEGRLLSAGLLPLHGVSQALLQIAAIQACGHVAAVTTTRPASGLRLDAPEHEPIWAALEAANLPLIVHTGAGCPGAAGDDEPNYLRSHVQVHPHEQQRAMVAMVLGGVLERHPGLRVGFFESGAGWLNYWCERM